MYTTLLGAALEQGDQPDSTATIGDLFANMLRTRTRVNSTGIHSPGQATTLVDVISQLEYDVSLISLVRRLDIDYRIELFDNGERHQLERALLDRGLPLDELDERR
jgi:hypothetical protein